MHSPAPARVRVFLTSSDHGVTLDAPGCRARPTHGAAGATLTTRPGWRLGLLAAAIVATCVHPSN